jgi:Type III secretion protein (HpaP)
MNNSALIGTVTANSAQGASALKPTRVITRSEQSQFESHFGGSAAQGAGAQAADFPEAWESADTASLDSSDIDHGDAGETASEHDMQVSRHRQRDSQSGNDDSQTGDEGYTPTLPVSAEITLPTGFVHPFQLLAAPLPGAAMAANLRAQQTRTSACWSQLNQGVNSLLVNTDPHAVNAPAAVLTLDSSLLPNTTLTLVRVPEGWVLQVHSQAFEVRRALRAHAGELEERFARLNLGHLRVEAVESTPDEQYL